MEAGNISQWYPDPPSDQNQPDLIAMPRKPQLTAQVGATAGLGFAGQDPIARHQVPDAKRTT